MTAGAICRISTARAVAVIRQFVSEAPGRAALINTLCSHSVDTDMFSAIRLLTKHYGVMLLHSQPGHPSGGKEY